MSRLWKNLAVVAVVLVLLCWYTSAHAVWNKVGEQRYQNSGLSFDYPTASGYCSGEAQRRFGAGVTSTITGNPELGDGRMRVDCDWTGGVLGSQHVTDSGYGLCVSGSWIPGGGGGCYTSAANCTPPQVPNAQGICETPACTAGQVVASGYFDYGTDPNKHPVILSCTGGCEAVFDGLSRAGNTLVDGVKHYFALGEYIGTGNTCTSGPDAGTGTPEIPPADCADGQVLGTVNEKPVCANGETGEAVVPPKTGTETTTTSPPVTNPDGSSTETSTTTTTETNPDGSETTTTKTTEKNCDVSGNCTTTETYETVGEEAAQEEEEDEQAGPAIDGAVPAVPQSSSLYAAKYENGFTGVWTQQSAALQQTPMFTFLSSLVPSFGDGGCPAWTFQAGSVLGIDVGGDISVPCYVWAFVRLVMIISALLLARRLIFGG